MKWFLAVFVCLIFCFNSVYALGISPARTIVDFESNLEKDVSFTVLNSGEGSINVILSAQGDLAKYISLPVKEAEISGESREFSYNLKLPEDLSPGLHTGEILAMQLPGSAESKGSHILSMLAVVTQVHLYVPYPGKYADAKMYVYSADVGEDVRFVIPVVSEGKFDLSSVRANVDIYNKLSEKVDSFDIDSISVPSGAKKELVYDWKADVEPGKYFARAAIIYDEGTINLEEMFSVGRRDLELQEIEVTGFSLGEVVKLNMLVENKWGEDIRGAHIKTVIKNSVGAVVSSFESAAQDVEALSKKNFVSYWDTAGVREGEYEVEVSIIHGDKVSKKELKFQVSENKLVVIGLGYVISAEKEGEGLGTVIVVLIIAIVILILINLLWFLLLRKKLKGKR